MAGAALTGLKRLAKVKSPAALAVGGRRFALVTNTPRCCSFTPVWSHDGKRLAWIYDGGLWTIRADGTEARQLATEGSHPSWSPDGARIVFEHAGADRQRAIYRVDAAGGDVRRLTAGISPAWSPDGVDARSGAVTELTTAKRTPMGLTIEGHRVVWAENTAGRSRVRTVTAP